MRIKLEDRAKMNMERLQRFDQIISMIKEDQELAFDVFNAYIDERAKADPIEASKLLARFADSLNGSMNALALALDAPKASIGFI